MQDAQNRMVLSMSAVGRHWYQECKWTWPNTKNEIYHDKTWELKTEHLYKRGDSVLDSYEEQEFWID